jgi:hypothetical protein
LIKKCCVIFLIFACVIAPSIGTAKEYKIDEYKLGVSFDEVSKALKECDVHEFTYEELGESVVPKRLYSCEVNDRESFGFHFDHKNILYRIQKFFKFDFEPDYALITVQLTEKFGPPIGETSSVKVSNESDFVKTLCFENCLEQDNGRFWKGKEYVEPLEQDGYSIFSRYSSPRWEGERYTLRVVMANLTLNNANILWIENAKAKRSKSSISL